MEWLTLLYEILQVCIIPLLGVLTTYIVKFINVKSEEIKATTDSELAAKYISMLTQTISDCVIATNQTYVEALKKNNAFTKEAQDEAFKKTYEAVLATLTDDAKEYLAEIYGDLNSYIMNKIEAEVNAAKN